MAASGPRWRRKHMMTCEEMPSLAAPSASASVMPSSTVAKGHAAIRVRLRVEEDLRMLHLVRRPPSPGRPKSGRKSPVAQC